MRPRVVLASLCSLGRSQPDRRAAGRGSLQRVEGECATSQQSVILPVGSPSLLLSPEGPGLDLLNQPALRCPGQDTKGRS